MKKKTKVSLLVLVLIACMAIAAYALKGSLSEDKDSGSSDKAGTEEFHEKLKDNAKENDGKNRVSGLLLGTDGARTDTMMFVTYDMEAGKLDFVSVPRDTYYENENAGAQFKKINAMYQVGGIERTAQTVQEVLGIEDEISFYARIDYAGVAQIVDSVGGVEVNVPSGVPSLEPGLQTLSGEQAVNFLRFRYGYENGDLGRVDAQQQFVSSFIGKALSMKLPSVISTAIQVIDTNASAKDALYYGMKMSSLDRSKISMTVIPGTARYQEVEGENLSYFFADQQATKELMESIMN